MVKGKARAAGSFLGGLANNPAVVIIALVLGGLFIFRDRISSAIGGIGEGLVNIELPQINFPEINFPEFPEINLPAFPEITFPDFSGLFSGFQDQLSSLAGQVVTLQGREVEIPPDTVVNPDGTVSSSTPPIVVSGGGATFEENLFATTRAGVFDTLTQTLGLSATQAGNILRGQETLSDLSRILFQANQGQFTPQGDQPIDQPIQAQDLTVQSFLTDQPLQQFEGGGVSFIGGAIQETPIEFLSLNQIINMFNVTASQAADIRAQAIGFTPEEEQFLQGSQDIGGFFSGFNPPAVSNQQFAGLTPQQIALQLTGGNISNF